LKTPATKKCVMIRDVKITFFKINQFVLDILLSRKRNVLFIFILEGENKNEFVLFYFLLRLVKTKKILFLANYIEIKIKQLVSF
jgi:hypothetical protein